MNTPDTSEGERIFAVVNMLPYDVAFPMIANFNPKDSSPVVLQHHELVKMLLLNTTFPKTLK